MVKSPRDQYTKPFRDVFQPFRSAMASTPASISAQVAGSGTPDGGGGPLDLNVSLKATLSKSMSAVSMDDPEYAYAIFLIFRGSSRDGAEGDRCLSQDRSGAAIDWFHLYRGGPARPGARRPGADEEQYPV